MSFKLYRPAKEVIAHDNLVPTSTHSSRAFEIK